MHCCRSNKVERDQRSRHTRAAVLFYFRLTEPEMQKIGWQDKRNLGGLERVEGVEKEDVGRLRRRERKRLRVAKV